MTVDLPLASAVKCNMENAYDNPVLTGDMPNERGSVNLGLNPAYAASFDSMGVNKNGENKNTVYVIPPYPAKQTNGFSNHVKEDKKNNASRKNEKEKEAYSNGINVNIEKALPPSDKKYIDYNPHEHIDHHKHPTTYWDTMFHLLKASLGTGILAMPNAFHNAGYLVGGIGTLVIGLLCTYNIHILLNSEYELCRRRKVPSMTFPEVLECAFEEGPQKLQWLAPYAKFLTNLFLVMYQFGSSAIYIVFIASNLKDVYDMNTGGNINIRIMMLYLLLPLVLICWVRNLKLLVPFSTVANAVTMLSFILIFRYIFDDIPSLKDREPVGNVHGIPLFFGTVLFAMEAIGVIMPLKNEMKKPQKFGSPFGVLNASMVPISILYAIIGFFGYLKYGDETAGSVTLNLPRQEFLSNAVRVLYSGSIYITYALSCYVAFDIIWINGIKQKITNKSTVNLVFWEYVVRTGIVFVIFAMAVAIPNLELFISFTGAFCLSTMGIAFPAITQILTYWCHREDTLRFSILVFKNIIIILIAIFAFTIGVSTTIMKFFE